MVVVAEAEAGPEEEEEEALGAAGGPARGEAGTGEVGVVVVEAGTGGINLGEEG